MRTTVLRIVIATSAILPMVSFAETIDGDITISDMNRVLSEDLTVNGVLKMSLGGFVDLNGHTLTAHGVMEDPNDVYPASMDSSGTADITQPSGVVESNSSQVRNLFDNDIRWSGSGSDNHRVLFANLSSSNPFWAIYDFGEGEQRTVTHLRVWFGCVGGQYVKRAPKNFTLEGSNDKAAWTTLCTKTGENWGSTWPTETNGHPVSKTYTCTTTGKYRYYRYQCTATQGGTDDGYLELCQLEFLATIPRITSGESGTTSDMTTPSGTVSSSGVAGGSAKALFNNNTTRTTTERALFSNVSSSNPHWVVYDFGAVAKRVVTKYKIYIANAGGATYSYRTPKNWTFEGSNDNSAWTILHTVSNESWGQVQTANRTYTVGTPGSYRYYKLKFTAGNGKSGDNYIELVELEYFGNSTGEGTLVIDTPSGDFVTNNHVMVRGGTAIEKRGEGTFENRLAFGNSGDTTVSGGVFALGVDNAIRTATDLIVGSGGTLDLGGHSQTVANLSGCGAVSNGTLSVTREINPGTDAATPETLTFGDVALSGSLVLDASAAGLDGISVASGVFDLGGLSLDVRNLQALPPGKYALVSSANGFAGDDFTSVPTLPYKWKMRRTATEITLGGRGFVIIVK